MDRKRFDEVLLAALVAASVALGFGVLTKEQPAKSTPEQMAPDCNSMRDSARGNLANIPTDGPKVLRDEGW